MAQYDSTYSLDGIDSSLNISEDGLHSITIQKDAPEAFNMVATTAAEVTVLDNLDGDFKYVLIFNLDTQNNVRIRTFKAGDYTIDEECVFGLPILIPARQYWGDATAAARELVSAESIKAQGIGFDVNIQVYFIK